MNPRGPGGLVLSDLPLSLAVNSPLSDYLAGHIRNALRNTGVRAAQFATIESGEPSGLCASILDGTADLVQASQILAEQLHAILEKDRRTKGSVLAVCRYDADNYPGVRFLALLKIDPSDVFRHRITETAGKKRVDLELDAEALTQENLQKCAFVQPLEPRHEVFDMMLLDTQVREGPRRDVAKYFATDFLKTVEAFDSYQRTRKLYKLLTSAHNQLRKVLSPQENEDLDDRIHSVMRSEAVNVDDWIGQLPLPHATRERIGQVVGDELPDREFDLNPKVAQELTHKRRFRGDYDLRVVVSARHKDQVIKSVKPIEYPDRGKVFRVTLETERWDEVAL